MSISDAAVPTLAEALEYLREATGNTGDEQKLALRRISLAAERVDPADPRWLAIALFAGYDEPGYVAIGEHALAAVAAMVEVGSLLDQAALEEEAAGDGVSYRTMARLEASAERIVAALAAWRAQEASR